MKESFNPKGVVSHRESLVDNDVMELEMSNTKGEG